MKKWRWLVAAVSLVQLGWGLYEFYDYTYSVGATGDATGGWVLSALGVLGFSALKWRRVAVPAALVQFAAATYAIGMLPAAIVFSNPPFSSPPIAWLILQVAGMTALICIINGVGVWQLRRAVLSTSKQPA